MNERPECTCKHSCSSGERHIEQDLSCPLHGHAQYRAARRISQTVIGEPGDGVRSEKFTTEPTMIRPNQRKKRRQQRNQEPRMAATKRGDTGEIELYGFVGGFFGDITAKRFKRELEALGAVKRIKLRVNSPGGSPFEAMSIYNQLIFHDATVEVLVEGEAASAATFFMMAASPGELRMAENSLAMIHEAQGCVCGRSKEVAKYSELLTKINNLAIDAYDKRTKLGRAKIVAEMDAGDFWMTAKEALKLGFIDEIAEPSAKEPPTPQQRAEMGPTSYDSSELDRAMEILESIAATSGDVNVDPEPPVAKDLPPTDEVTPMHKDLKAKCVAAGMAANLPDAEADVWLLNNSDKVFGQSATATLQVSEIKPDPAVAELQKQVGDLATMVKENFDAQAASTAATKRAADITAMCKAAGSDKATEYIADEKMTADAVRTVLFNELVANRKPVPPGADKDKKGGPDSPEVRFGKEYDEAQKEMELVGKRMFCSREEFIEMRIADENLGEVDLESKEEEATAA